MRVIVAVLLDLDPVRLNVEMMRGKVAVRDRVIVSRTSLMDVRRRER